MDGMGGTGGPATGIPVLTDPMLIALAVLLAVAAVVLLRGGPSWLPRALAGGRRRPF